MTKTSLLQCPHARQATTGDAMTYAILDYVAVISLLLLGLLTLVFRRRIFRPVERLTIRAAAWSLFDETPPSRDRSESEVLTNGERLKTRQSKN
jgi:hypothetical protein